MYRPARGGAKNMAELDFDHFESGHGLAHRSAHGSGHRAGHFSGRAAQVSQMMNIGGAACSIALVVGLGVWGYKLAVRDVNGVPVIRALAGPMREMPQVPGGDVASHQGLSVNAVAAVGSAAAVPDQVLLAPAPVALAAEDAAGFGVAMARADAAPAAPLLVEVGTSTLNPSALSAQPDMAAEVAEPDPAPTPEAIDTDAAVAMALADALAVGAEPFTELASADVNDLGAPPVIRPRPRPSQPTANAAAEVAPVVESAAPPVVVQAEIDPATLAVGTRLVQLGAFDNDADARTEWSRLQARFGELLAEKAMVIQAAQSGGRTFYRLRAHGFADEDDARRFCAALVAENTPCIPALHR